MRPRRTDAPAPGDLPPGRSAAGRADPVVAAIRAALADLPAMPGIVVALSGGRDSMVLLDALCALTRLPGSPAPALRAVHVHHGLSPHADDWAGFCAAECGRRGVPLEVRRVEVPRQPGASLEATARAARYAALAAAAGAAPVALAHHADDQAETVLLQLLRGAGPLGLAAMPSSHAAAGATFFRPLLPLPRAAIDAYAAARGVAWIDDESNADTGIRRNFLRHEIAPRLAGAFAGYPSTLARSAAHSAEAAMLLDELAALDAGAAVAADADGWPTLLRAALAALSPPRARNVLRWFVRRTGLPLPSAARLAAMHAQFVRAAPDAQVRIVHAGVEFGLHRGRIAIHPVVPAPYAVGWQGESELGLPHGILAFAPVAGAGLSAALLAAGTVVVRPRAGGERIRLAGDRPRHAVRRLLQQAGMPAWQRDGWPLVWCGDTLAAVPGIGVAAGFAAEAAGRGYALSWHPAAFK